MKEFSVNDHAPSLLPDEGDFRLVWQDEFDGPAGAPFDDTKWDYRVSMMGKAHPAWVRDGASLDGNGNLAFRLLAAEDGRPVSAQLQTGYNFMDEPTIPTKFGADALQWNIGRLHENRFTHTYGYYECRCRLQQREGWWSAFWMQSPIIGASLDPAESGTEIDIMECFTPGNVIAHNAFTGGYGLDMKNAHTSGDLQLDKAEFHRFGLLWDETGYTFYVDGQEDGHISEYVSRRPEFILISTEVKGYRYENHQPVEAAFASQKLGDEFLVDYVRVFDRV